MVMKRGSDPAATTGEEHPQKDQDRKGCYLIHIFFLVGTLLVAHITVCIGLMDILLIRDGFLHPSNGLPRTLDSQQINLYY